MDVESDVFWSLLRCALGNQKKISENISHNQWRDIYALAHRQYILGILFPAIEQLETAQYPPHDILYPWIAYVERIKCSNHELNTGTVAISSSIRNAGFRSVILKGQGNALYYPQPDNRTPGDIDIWMEGTRQDILQYVNTNASNCTPLYHHVSFSLDKYKEIEVHFMPSWMNEYFTNRKLQCFFREHEDEQMNNAINFYGISNDICVPTLAFNRVYLLVHIYRHLFHEGITLKQLIDYYYVLSKGFTEREKSETVHELKRLGMLKFTAAIMYILHNVFGLDSQYLLTNVNVKDGRRILKGIMSDNVIPYANNNSTSSLHKLSRNFKFLYSYPREAISSPFFTIWHYLWRKKNR